MNLTEQQYERIARRLDGEDVALSAYEQAACDEIADGQAQLAPALETPAEAGSAVLRQTGILAQIGMQEKLLGEMLDVDVPQAAIDKAWERTRFAMARPQRILFRVGAIAASVAVAAGVLLTLTLTGPQPGGPVAPGMQQAEAYVASVAAVQDPAIELLAAEIDQLEAEVLASAPPVSLDIGLDQAERAIEELWLDDMLVE